MSSSLRLKQAIHIALFCGATTGLAFAGQAMASGQDQAAAPAQSEASAAKESTTLKAVEVTGSRIKRVNLEEAQPFIVMTKEDIKASGLTTIGDVLQTLTSAGSSLNTNLNNFGLQATRSTGQTTLSLRNLGAQRTLVLVNGHRWATSLSGVVDLNTIPSSIIDHVEILQDGASAIYGSDAIAGVVNIITMKNYEGAEVNAYTGVHNGDGHWDGLTRNYNVTFGTQSDRGGLLLSASFNEQDGISAMNRVLTATGNPGRGTTTIPQGRFMFIPPYGGDTLSPDNFPALSTGLTAALCPARNYGSKAAPRYLPVCELTTIKGMPGTDPSHFKRLMPEDKLNTNEGSLLTTPDQRISTYASGHYQLTDGLRFSMDATFSRRHSSSQSPSPIGFAGSQDVFIPGNPTYSPFNFDLSTTAPVGPGLLIVMAKRLSGLGLRLNTQNENMVHVRSGLDGSFEMAGSMWDWDAGYAFSKATEVDTTSGIIDGNRFYVQLGDPAACAADAAKGCMPVSLFGGQTKPATAEQLAYSSYVDRFVYERSMRSLYANITNSSVFQLPAGSVGFAAGYQFISNSGSFQPGAIAMQQVNPISPTAGSTDINAVYAEVAVPLLANLPLAKAVNLDLATRRTKAQSGGNSSNNVSSRAGLTWQPTEEILLRASWSQGFRSPVIDELYSGRLSHYFSGTDPCSNYLNTGVPTYVQDACAAQGVPPSYIQGGQMHSNTFGNTALKPETTVSRTFGIVYSPDWLAGFNMNVDYYKIVLKNTIQSFGGQNILDSCYYLGVQSNCSRIHRRPNGTGDMREIDDSLTNIGGTTVSGVDVGASYVFPATSFGKFSYDLTGSYTQKYEEYFPTGTGGVTVTSLAGIERGGTIFPLGIPRWKALGTLNWRLGSWGASWSTSYVSSLIMKCSDNLDGTALSYTNLGMCSMPNLEKNHLSKNRFGARIYNDARVSFNYEPWKATFALGVKNVFNKEPPKMGFDRTVYRLPGRMLYASAGVKF